MARPSVTLVIPGRNCEHTLAPCLAAAADIRDRCSDTLSRVIYVDDGSTDGSRDIAAQFPVEVLHGEGRGVGAARNVGWEAATTELVWFVGCDGVAEPEAFASLLPHVERGDADVVSGSCGIMNRVSLLACLIHEEIIERHIRVAASERAVVLDARNVLMRREVLASVGGFDERYRSEQDAELASRVLGAGRRVAFEFDSRVQRFHEERLGAYLRDERRRAFWRVRLRMGRRVRSCGDPDSSLVDRVRPLVAVMTLASVPLGALLLIGSGAERLVGLAPVIGAGLLVLLNVPMAVRVVWRTGEAKYALIALLGATRAVWRGLGMAAGAVSSLRSSSGGAELSLAAGEPRR